MTPVRLLLINVLLASLIAGFVIASIKSKIDIHACTRKQ